MTDSGSPSPGLDRVQALLALDRELAGRGLQMLPEWLASEPMASTCSARLLAEAFEGLRSQAAGDRQRAGAAFEIVAQSPIPLPGALTLAYRYFIAAGCAEQAAVCLGRLQMVEGGPPGPPGTARRGGAVESPEHFAVHLRATRGRDLVAQMKFKRSLVDRFGAFDAAVCYAQVLSAGIETEVVEKPLRSLRDEARDRARVYSTVAGRCELELPLTEVIGADPIRSQRVNGRELFIACLDDVRVGWRSSLLETREALLYDYQDEELAAVPPEFGCDAQAFRLEGRRLSLIRHAPVAMALDQAIGLTGAASYAFGHWITEFLYKLFLIEHSGLAPGVPIVVDQGMPASHREALDWFVAGRRPVIELPAWGQAQVERLWIASTTAYMPFYPGVSLEVAGERWLTSRGEVMAALTEVSRRPSAGGLGRGRRLFMARRPHLHRRLINQGEVKVRLREHGYEVVYGEDLSFAEQYALIESASHIVGPSGSAMLFAVLWALPGTRIGFLNTPFLDGIATLNLSAIAQGVELHVVKGELARKDERFLGFSDYSIPPDHLHELLVRMEFQ